MQQTATLDDVVRAIEHFRSRIDMYMHPIDVSNTQSFLAGIAVAVKIVGIRRDRDTWWEVQKRRGWKQASVGPVPQMREQGMTEQQIINELIDIEVEVLRLSNASA